MLKRDHFPESQERFNLDETVRLPRRVCKRQSRDDKGRDGFMTSRHEQALRGRDGIPIIFFLHIFHVISMVLFQGLQAKCTIPDDDRRGSLMVERPPGSTVKCNNALLGSYSCIWLRLGGRGSETEMSFSPRTIITRFQVRRMRDS